MDQFKHSIQHLDDLTQSKAPASQLSHFLSRMAVHAWSMRRHLAGISGNDRAFVCLEAMQDLLHEMGVQIKDYASQRYFPGQNLEILAFAPASDVEFDTIGETVRPAVFLKGDLILRSQVIVATPLRKIPE